MYKHCIYAALVLSSSQHVDANAQATASQDTQDDLTQTEQGVQQHKQKCQTVPESAIWLDRFRSSAHTRLCNTVMWIDSKFGDKHEFADRDFRAKLSLGFRQDETDGFDPRIRVRIRSKLPNVSSRLNAFIGRVDEDSYVSNTEVDQDSVTNVGLRSADDEEDEWLVGIGYKNPTKQNQGFDYSIGAKISSGLNPYARITHRRVFEPSAKHYWHSTQTLFWRDDDGLGVSSSLDYTYLMNKTNIIEWDTTVKYTEKAEQWEWLTSSNWHHSLSNKTGISSRIYIRGEQENPVSIPEYGIAFTYIRPFLRPWLLVETGVDFRWEKENDFSSYKSATRFALQFEMLLGDYYQRNRKK